MANHFFGKDGKASFHRWIGNTTPVLYGFRVKDASGLFTITTMDLRNDLVLVKDWKRPVLSASIQGTRYPSGTDCRDLMRFYRKELSSKLRLFPFVVRKAAHIVLCFDCLAGKNNTKKKRYPFVYVFVILPSSEQADGLESMFKAVLPHVLGFLNRSMGRRRCVFILPSEQDISLSAFMGLPFPGEIEPPTTETPYWRITIG